MFETECLGLCGAKDSFRQTFIDTNAKAGFVKFHDRKTQIMAANLRNGQVLPFHAQNGGVPRGVLIDRGTE